MPAESSTPSKFPNEAEPPEDIPDDQHDAHDAADGLTRWHTNLNSQAASSIMVRDAVVLREHRVVHIRPERMIDGVHITCLDSWRGLALNNFVRVHPRLREAEEGGKQEAC